MLLYNKNVNTKHQIYIFLFIFCNFQCLFHISSLNMQEQKEKLRKHVQVHVYLK